MNIVHSQKDDGSFNLRNQKILVTGVSRSLGIGRAITERCANAGASIAIHGYPDYDIKIKYKDATYNSTNEFVKELSSKGYNVKALTKPVS